MTSHRIETVDPGFGRAFTPHMVIARFEGDAWSAPEVVQLEALRMSPAAMALHYGQAIFEGLKAYRQPDGSVSLFRPAMNAERFERSARRLAMPPLADGVFVDSCMQLVRADHGEVPSIGGQSLYLRPMMIATEAALGVRPAREYLYAVIASPAGSYFHAGLHPITVWVAEESIRAAPGGTGAVKTAGNYAASLVAKAEAVHHGCDDVLFLDALERRWIEELSGMNVVFVERRAGRSTLVSPPANGTILDGVTRRSLLELGARLGHEILERPVGIDEVLGGAFDEAFACGTAAVVAPIGAVRSTREAASIGDGGVGVVTRQLRAALVALQEGRADDAVGWMVPVPQDATGPRGEIGAAGRDVQASTELTPS